MSETSQDSNNSHIQLINAIEETAKRAKHNQLRFLILSLAWVMVLAVLAFVFVYETNRLSTLVDNSLARIAIQSAQMTALKADIEQNKELISELIDNNFSILSANFNDLNKAERKKLVNTLIEQDNTRTGTSSSGRLTQSQADFLSNFANVEPEDMETAEEVYQKGSAEYSLGNLDEAIALLTSAIENYDEPYVPAFLSLGKAYIENEEFELAINTFNASLLIEEDPFVRSWNCFAYNNGSLHDETIKEDLMAVGLNECNIAIRDNPDYWWAYNTRGFTNLLIGNYDAAIADWQHSAELYWSPSYVEENIGIAYLHAQDWQKAYDWSVEFRNTYETNSTWNGFVMAVAADKLDRDDAEQVMENWQGLLQNSNVASLQKYTAQFSEYFEID